MLEKPLRGIGFAVGTLGILAAANPTRAAVDTFTLRGQPANALVMPFDLVERTTLFLVSNVAGVSPIDGGSGGSIAGVSTHWAFWSRNGDHLFDANICLSLNDTVAVDASNVQSVDAGNQRFGPVGDLSGKRGFVVVTAYATNETCDPGTLTGLHLVNGALTGRFTISNLADAGSIGDGALGFATLDGVSTTLPDVKLSPSDISFDRSFISIQTFNPAILESSTAIFLALEERGAGAPWTGEIGPLRKPVTAWSVFYDDLEIATSLPDLSFRVMRFVQLGPAPGGLIPATVSVASAGELRLERWTYGRKAKEIGCKTFVYAFFAPYAGNGIIDFTTLADYLPSDATCP